MRCRLLPEDKLTLAQCIDAQPRFRVIYYTGTIPQTHSYYYSSLSATLQNITMSDKYEECIAHVIWAAHILYYLVGERSQTRLLPELDEEEDFDGDELDVKTENKVILTRSGDLVRSRFLDCVAELVSPSKGWDHVIATGLRESIDSIEIDITRNDGFGIAAGLESGTFRAGDADTQYFEHLQRYLASASEESMNFRTDWNDGGKSQR